MAKKALFIIAFKGFKDPEYFIPKDILESAGIRVFTASTEKGTALGDDGGQAEVDFTVEESNISDFDAIAFVGGPGMSLNLDNENFQKAAREAFEKGKIVSAICIAPVVLAKSGVLKGRKATVWSAPMNKQAVKILEKNGADYQGKSVVEDGSVITAYGPSAAEDFGKALARKIKS
jgi:protease I